MLPAPACAVRRSRNHGELNGAVGMPRRTRAVRRHIIRHHSGRPTMTHRFGTLIVAALFALSLPLGAAFAGRRARSAAAQPASLAAEEQSAVARHKAEEERQDSPSRNSATAIAPPTRWCRPATTRRPSRRSRSCTPTTRRTWRTISATRRASSATTRPRATGTSARSPPTRTTCAPGSITACGTSSRATCSRPQDFLEKIRLICGGTACKEYQDLKGGMEGTVVY